MDPKSGISEDQVEGFIDTIVGLPDWLLVLVGRAINWAVEVWPTVQAGYGKVDDWTLGCAKYLLMAVVFYLLYVHVCVCVHVSASLPLSMCLSLSLCLCLSLSLLVSLFLLSRTFTNPPLPTALAGTLW